MKNRRSLATTGIRTLLPALLWLAGCGKTGALRKDGPIAWAAGPSEVISMTEGPRQQTDCFNVQDNLIRVSAAVNETTAFEFVLSGQSQPLRGIEIGVEDFVSPSGTIPRDAVKIYRHWPITIDRYPNWYYRSVGQREPRAMPDALVPIGAPQFGRPFTLTAGENLVFWIDIEVPATAAVDVYKSVVVVQGEGGATSRTPIELNVRDLIFGPEDGIAILGRVQLAPIIAAHTKLDPQNMRLVLSDPEARRVLSRTFKLLQDHGVSPFTDEVRPGFTQDIDGSIKIDWQEYDDFCGPLLDGGDGFPPAAAWPLPVDLKQPDPARYQGMESTTYTSVLRAYMQAAAQHFTDKKWIDRAFVYFDTPTRPNPQAEDIERVRRLAILTHLVDIHLNFVTRLIPQPMAPYGWFEHHYEDLSSAVNTWCTPARYTRGATLEYLQKLGQHTWLLPDRPPFSGSLAVEAPPIHARSLAWQAFLQGHSAIYLDQVTHWPANGFEKPIVDRSQRTDAWLVYPGTLFGLNEPVPSVRLKQLRTGLQDYQRLHLLARKDRTETARLLAGSLIKAMGTDAYGDNYQDGLLGRRIDDPTLWELARKILNEELKDALRENADVSSDHDTVRSDWVRFLAATRKIEVQPESAKLALDSHGPDRKMLLSFDVLVRSELRAPLSGELSFGPLPLIAGRVNDHLKIGPLQEMGLVRRKLVMSLPTVPPTDLDGHFAQKIVFDAHAQGYTEIDASAAVVQTPRVSQSLNIDGHLDDWPPGEFNAAGDFRLIRANAGQSREKAQSQTIAYFLHDNEMLYIGIHAGAPTARSDHPASPPPLRNFVEYEDLMPLDEDLVEILIDPTNKGTQSDDLYHIVLKSTGIAIFEHGIGTIPPIGKVEPWPGRTPLCCVAQTEYGWSAELAIPLAAFGTEATSNPIWGLNLSRLEPVHGEYSDWAQAPRHCYDPRTLGNLFWRE